MPLIEMTTIIDAPIGRCFDLSRSIDLHKLSTTGTNEEAIAGVTSGLIGKDQFVTWRATHFGVTQTLTSIISECVYPSHFRDELVDGIFKTIKHDHLFSEVEGRTIMKDVFYYESPGWILGMIFNQLVLTRYLRKLLVRRNAIIKDFAEGDRWKEVLT